MTTTQLDTDFKMALKKTINEIKGFTHQSLKQGSSASRKKHSSVSLSRHLNKNQISPVNCWQPNHS
jgi:hypothetical protein